MRDYYSVRTGKNKNFSGFGLVVLARLFHDTFKDFRERGYFDEHFGYTCVDAGDIPGKLGPDISGQIYRVLRKENLWPIELFLPIYSEDDFLDMVEFLYDHVSLPLEEGGYLHSYAECGWHYENFDRAAGQEEFRRRINEIINNYSTGFELSADGIVLVGGENALADMFSAGLSGESDEVRVRVEGAVQKYRTSRSEMSHRRDAVRDLADVLELLRKDAKQHLDGKDEADLFNIANNFAIRHANESQKVNYDKNIWYSWMFYFYLATILALVRMKERGKKTAA